MQVINTRVGLLSNYEVFSLLKDMQSEHKTHNTSDNVRFIQNETLRYLSDPAFPSTSQNEHVISSLLEQLSQFSTLTTAEKLMIVNIPPKSIVELYVIVEELEDRLSEQDIEAILSIVQSSLNHRTDDLSGSSNANPTAPNPDQPLFEDDDEENAKYEMEAAEQEEFENADVGEDEGRAIDEVDE
ncbi:hypothetical protein E3P77_02187 [Wallemia ichthyophaga]|nr:hypothetical protein E3P77_02187 [Wallemia ichthyophaga]